MLDKIPFKHPLNAFLIHISFLQGSSFRFAVIKEALEVMNLDNYLAFASIFAQDIHYPDLKKLIMDYFESLKNYKEYATFVWDMVELSNQLKNEIH